MSDLSSAAAKTTIPARRLRHSNTVERWRRGLMGYALGWGWFDGVAAWALRRYFFPASRLWAAAQLADGSPERFCEAACIPRREADRARLAKALARFEKARARAVAVEAEWQRVFFGPDDTPPAYRNAVEAARRDAAHAYNATRRLFAFLLREAAPARLETQAPDQVAAAYGEPARFAEAVAAPDPMPAIERSRSISASNGSDHWLRFKSPSAILADTVHARVLEPRDAADAPTLIFGHGICVEFDHWRGLIEEAERLRDAGFRVIRPEAPWHGRRTPRGEFGGQRMMTHFPLGLLDGLSAAIQEWAVLAHWARETSGGPLAFGGTSLGAQTAQLAADRARNWPVHLRPQGLFLVTHCVRMVDATVHGGISAIFGAVHDVRAKGWTQEALEAWLGELDPRSPPVPAERIVTVLGRRDSITPFRSARPVTDDWGIPAANQFLWDRGHFSVPMTLIRDPRPVARFRAVMQSAR